MRDAYRRLPYLLAALGAAGLAISVYLVATHYGKTPIACGGVGDCNYVNSSEYASIGGIPVSVLGIGMYATLIAAALYWSHRPADERRMVLYWGLALAGVGYAGYLTYVEVEILHAICVWCVTSASVLTLSLLLATAALFWVPQEPATPQKPYPPVKSGGRTSRPGGAKVASPARGSQASSTANQSSYKRRRLSP